MKEHTLKPWSRHSANRASQKSIATLFSRQNKSANELFPFDTVKFYLHPCTVVYRLATGLSKILRFPNDNAIVCWKVLHSAAKHSHKWIESRSIINFAAFFAKSPPFGGPPSCPSNAVSPPCPFLSSREELWLGTCLHDSTLWNRECLCPWHPISPCTRSSFQRYMPSGFLNIFFGVLLDVTTTEDPGMDTEKPGNLTSESWTQTYMVLIWK